MVSLLLSSSSRSLARGNIFIKPHCGASAQNNVHLPSSVYNSVYIYRTSTHDFDLLNINQIKSMRSSDTYKKSKKKLITSGSAELFAGLIQNNEETANSPMPSKSQ